MSGVTEREPLTYCLMLRGRIPYINLSEGDVGKLIRKVVGNTTLLSISAEIPHRDYDRRPKEIDALSWLDGERPNGAPIIVKADMKGFAESVLTKLEAVKKWMGDREMDDWDVEDGQHEAYEDLVDAIESIVLTSMVCGWITDVEE